MGKEIKITPPDGFKIDKENSTFECIKFKPIVKRWRDYNSIITGYYLKGNRIIYVPDDSHRKYKCSNYDVFATEKQAKSALAMAQISQIMANDERFGGIITDEEWKDPTVNKFVIVRLFNAINKFSFVTGSFYFLSFHTQEQRDLFFEENEDLIKDYLMID